MTERVLQLVSSRLKPAEDDREWDGGEAAILGADEGWRELRRELDRSRRFGHAFVLMRMARHWNGADVVRALPSRLRSVESVWGVRKHAYVLVPEADHEIAAALVARLRREAPDLLPADVRFAAFPSDGLTSGALLELLDRPVRVPAEEKPTLDVALHHGLTRA